MICLKSDLTVFDLETFSPCACMAAWFLSSCSVNNNYTIFSYHRSRGDTILWFYPALSWILWGITLIYGRSELESITIASHQCHSSRCTLWGLRGPASPELSCLNEFAGVTCDACCSGHSWGPESELEGWLVVHRPELFIYYPLHSILLLQLTLLCLACILKRIVQIHRKISHVSILQLEIPCFTAAVLNNMRRKDNFWDRCFSINTCFCAFCTHPAFLCSPSLLSQITSDTP